MNTAKTTELENYLQTHEGKDALVQTLAEALEEQTLSSQQFESMFSRQQAELINLTESYSSLRGRCLELLSDILIICDDDDVVDFAEIVDNVRNCVESFLRKEM